MSDRHRPRLLDDADGECETVHMAKSGIGSAELATAFWSDLLKLTHRRMDDLEGDEYDIEIEVVIRE